MSFLTVLLRIEKNSRISSCNFASLGPEIARDSKVLGAMCAYIHAFEKKAGCQASGHGGQWWEVLSSQCVPLVRTAGSLLCWLVFF